MAHASGARADPTRGRRRRGSILAKAVRFEAGKRKIKARGTGDDLAVHSFQSLIADLATVTRSTMAMGDHLYLSRPVTVFAGDHAIAD